MYDLFVYFFLAILGFLSIYTHYLIRGDSTNGYKLEKHINLSQTFKAWRGKLTFELFVTPKFKKTNTSLHAHSFYGSKKTDHKTKIDNT